MVDYRHRGVHVVECRDTGLQFQVLTYGLPDVNPGALELRMEKRGGVRIGVYDMESRYCDDKFNHSGARARTPGVSYEAPPRHFFNRRIDVVEETIQARRDARGLGARDGARGQAGGGAVQVEEGRDAGDHQGDGR